MTSRRPRVLTESLRTCVTDSATDQTDPTRSAIVASFGNDPTPSRSLTALVGELDRSGYSPVVVRASDRVEMFDTSGLKASGVIRKANIGYDFGSWATGMACRPGLLTASHVLLVNDSLVGPFAPLDALLADFEQATTDVWAATRTTQFFPHLQSFFMGFHGGVLVDPAMRRFWRGLQVETDKQRIIAQYELGFNRLLFGEGYSVTAAFEPERVVAYGKNPSVTGWERLLDLGFPFVKRELIVNPGLVEDGHRIRPTIIERFGVDPLDWV